MRNEHVTSTGPSRARLAGLLVALVGLALSGLTFVGLDQADAQTDQDPVCVVGTLDDGQCVEVGDAPTLGSAACPTADDVVDTGTSCYRLVPKVGGDTCPDTTTPDPDGTSCRAAIELVEQQVTLDCPDGFDPAPTAVDTCVRSEPALQADAACPVGARGQAGACYVVTFEVLECFAGVLAGDSCVITGNPPVNGPATCPVSSIVIQTGVECYMLVEAPDGVCPVGTTPDPATETCRRPVDLRPGALVCSLGFGLVNGTCIRYETPFGGQGCPADAPVDAFGLCRQPVDDRSSTVYCPSAAQLVGADCVTTISIQGECEYNTLITGCTDVDRCPVQFDALAEFGGFCARYEPSSRSQIQSCPAGSLGAPGACYIVVAKGPSGFPGASPQCPVGSVEDAAGSCRKPVANASPPYFCASPNAGLLGRTCIFVSAPIPTGSACPAGFTLIADTCVQTEPASVFDTTCITGNRMIDGRCFLTFAPTLSADAFCVEGSLISGVCTFVGTPLTTTSFCPVSATVMEEGAECFATFSFPDGIACPAGTTRDPSGFACRRPIDRRPGAATCNAGFVIASNVCTRYSAPVVQTISCPRFTTQPSDGSCLVQTSPAQGDFYCESPLSTLEWHSCVFRVPLSANCSTAQALEGECGVPTPSCPSNYSPDSSLGGLCARFEPASQLPDSCPAGARGEAGECYILVAKGPAGASACEVGTLVGTTCAILGDPPVNGPSTCPVSAVVFQSGNECYTLVPPPASANDCATGYSPLGSVCKRNNSGTTLTEIQAFECPATIDDATVLASMHTIGGLEKIESCTYTPVSRTGSCPVDTPPDPNGTDCRVPADLRPGSLVCAAFFGIVDGQCVRYESPLTTARQCPTDSTEDAEGNCRKPVADAQGALYCEDESAALNGRSCVFVTGFVIACDSFGNTCSGGTQTESVCPVSALVIQDGTECFMRVSFAESMCPTDTTPDPDSTLCREPVGYEPGPLQCAVDFVLIDGQCLRFSDPKIPPSPPVSDQDGGEGGDLGESEGALPLVSLQPTDVSFSGCAGGTASYELLSGATVVASGALTEGATGNYTGTYIVDTAGSYELAVQISCPDGTTDAASAEVVFIDPSGRIFDCAGDPVEGATVTLLRQTTTGELVAVADGDATVMDPTVNVNNPSLSDANGFYRWDVVAGSYQVSVSLAGQITVMSDVLPVPPERTDVDLVLADLNCVEEVAPTATPVPTAVVVTGNPVRPAAPEFAADAAPASPPVVIPETVTNPVSQPGLAVTGTDSGDRALMSLVFISAGFVALGLSRTRRRVES